MPERPKGTVSKTVCTNNESAREFESLCLRQIHLFIHIIYNIKIKYYTMYITEVQVATNQELIEELEKRERRNKYKGRKRACF